MSRFLIFYFVFYGGANLYFYVKLWRALPLGRRCRTILALPQGLLFIAPLLARGLDARGWGLSAEFASFAGYWWMGLLFLFVCASLPIDLVNLIIIALKRMLRTSRPAPIPPRTAVIVPALYAAAIAVYGYHEARDIRTEQVTIRTAKIPAAVGRIRIVQITDVHAGQIVREKRIREILRVVAAAAPDLIVSTGDLVDGHQRHFTGLEPLFRELRPPLGTYAVTGNHEYYIGLEKAVRFTEDAGFRLLMDESVVAGDHLTIIGLADQGRQDHDPTRELVERKLLASSNHERFRLLLKHRPAVLHPSIGNFDLQLSGHVHKGQIFPFNLLTWLAYPIRTGLTDLGSGSLIYVSRGTGVWGPPIRLLAPPEVTVIDLVAERTADQ